MITKKVGLTIVNLSLEILYYMLKKEKLDLTLVKVWVNHVYFLHTMRDSGSHNSE